MKNVQDACEYLDIECADKLNSSATVALETLITFVENIHVLTEESVGVVFRDHHVAYWDELGLFGEGEVTE